MRASTTKDNHEALGDSLRFSIPCPREIAMNFSSLSFPSSWRPFPSHHHWKVGKPIPSLRAQPLLLRWMNEFSRNHMMSRKRPKQYRTNLHVLHIHHSQTCYLIGKEISQTRRKRTLPLMTWTAYLRLFDSVGSRTTPLARFDKRSYTSFDGLIPRFLWLLRYDTNRLAGYGYSRWRWRVMKKWLLKGKDWELYETIFSLKEIL